MKVPAAHVMGAAEVRRLLPPRPRESHKGDYGKLLLLCGSTGLTGAASLAAQAALRMGAGLVYLGVPEAVYPIAAGKALCEVVFPLPCDEAGRLSAAAAAPIRTRLAGMDAVLFGPGLGRSAQLTELLAAVLEASRAPVILDADGINALCGHMDLVRGCRQPVLLTPHDGEFARLTGQAPGPDRAHAAMDLAGALGAVVLLKGHRTLITDGTKLYRNHTGNPGMATGGSGDVLSGMLAALLGFHLPPLAAAAAGAYLHGRAGDLAAAKFGEYSLLPSDLPALLPRLLCRR
mgnify:CR=1 FL=1